MNYPYDAYRAQVETHAFWVAKSKVLNGCVGQGDSIEEAVEELQIIETAWVECAKEIGLSIPEIPIEHLSAYSGKLTLRISPYEHEEAAMLARKEGISLNQYISDAVVARNHEMTTVDYVSDNLDNDDLPELFSSYSTFEDDVQKTILHLAVDSIDEVISISTAADQALIDDLLKAENIDKSVRLELLIANMPSLDMKETAEYLVLLGKESFVKIFDSTTRPRFNDTQQNTSLLDAFVAKGWIHEYYQDDDDYLRIRRHALRN